jgi:PBP1b-binding outer membrane lipoprotein LpoB
MKRLLIAAALVLSGCATGATRKSQTVEVKVPVAVQPIKPEQVPAVPAPLGPRPQSLSAAAECDPRRSVAARVGQDASPTAAKIPGVR